MPPHLEEVEAPRVHLRMRGVNAGHHAAVKRVLPVQAQAVPLRPQESEREFYKLRKIKGDILMVQLKCHFPRVDNSLFCSDRSSGSHNLPLSVWS